MMLSLELALISSITVARVVDLPEPVTPVTRTRPSRNFESLERLSGRLRLEKVGIPSISILKATLMAPF